ncbi:hypothetical protein [Arthrobacter psychrochitiniphilus]|uniref:hypothetical protein n=1 Tax=Arthrobacter psychrochitiniphilus TaxID=291045 RepID=UPI003F7CD30C
METSHTARLHLELDLEFTNPGAVQAHALAWARDNAGENAQTLAGMVEQVGEGAESALMMLVEPSEVVAGIPGVQALGATMWVQGTEDESEEDEDAAGTDSTLADEDDFTLSTPHAHGSGALESEDGEEDEDSEDEWLEKIFSDGAKLPGLDLVRLGYDPEESNPDRRGSQLREATMLRGAINWAYVSLIDELFEDLSLLRESTESAAETQQIANLPPLHAASYGPLFAQQFLTVAIELGSALATEFAAPSCVAQELALKLVLDQVEALESMLPNMALAQDWRGMAEDTLYEDLDHELLYDPAMDGISSSPLNESLGIADLNLSAWFTPFNGRAVNPYAADED